MGAEDRHGAVGNLIQLLDKDRAHALELLDHMAIVHDFVADIDRGAEFLESPLDDLDRPHDAGAETSGLSHKNPHPDQFLPQGQSRQTACWVALPDVQRQTRHGGPIDEQAS